MSGCGEDEGYPFRFACKRSGNCCSRPEGRVRVTSEELPALARSAGLEEDAFLMRYCTSGPDGSWLLKSAPSSPACIFLEMNGPLASCRVYEARPSHCRSFPFWEELREAGPVLKEALRFCPGLEPREPRI